MSFYFTTAGRLFLACLLGGFVGYEREHTNRPAGFRTHILVCVGSALVMLTSEFIFNTYIGLASFDPTRLGAQVISGIGFLGAGTIIREGFDVRGLTTAASLWAVACVGIASGAGFYSGAIAATIIIYITLILLKKIESNLSRKNRSKAIYIKSLNLPGQIGAISNIFFERNVKIRNIEFKNEENENDLVVKFLISMPNYLVMGLMNNLRGVEGVKEVFEEE